MKKTIFLFLLICSNIIYAELPKGDYILKKIDKNYKADNRISSSTMIIKGRRGSRTIKAKSWAKGIDKVFTQYLYPAREKDTKMLKLKHELWIWSPAADRIIKIAGHMLRQSLMGSDVSYEDFMEDPELDKNYSAKVIGQEKYQERMCYILELKAKKDKVAYHSRKLWVDKERYLPLKENRFAKSGKLLKTFYIDKVSKIGNRWYPTKMVFKDVLKQGDGTQLLIDSIEFDTKIPDHIFSKAALRR
ncbi:outer membrane lipoprotein-sorting protein [bacterium]